MQYDMKDDKYKEQQEWLKLTAEKAYTHILNSGIGQPQDEEEKQNTIDTIALWLDRAHDRGFLDCANWK